MGEDGSRGEFQKTMGDLEHGYLVTTDPPMKCIFCSVRWVHSTWVAHGGIYNISCNINHRIKRNCKNDVCALGVPASSHPKTRRRRSYQISGEITSLLSFSNTSWAKSIYQSILVAAFYCVICRAGKKDCTFRQKFYVLKSSPASQ